jgi:hypothetical protein
LFVRSSAPFRFFFRTGTSPPQWHWTGIGNDADANPNQGTGDEASATHRGFGHGLTARHGAGVRTIRFQHDDAWRRNQPEQMLGSGHAPSAGQDGEFLESERELNQRRRGIEQ